MAVSDEELGRAIRTIARHLNNASDGDRFDWYAEEMIRAAEGYESGKNTAPAERITVKVYPVGAVDGMVERLVEMVTGKPCAAVGLPRPSVETIRRDLGVLANDIEQIQGDLLRAVTRRLAAIEELLGAPASPEMGQYPSHTGHWWLYAGMWSAVYVHDPTGDGLQIADGPSVSSFPAACWGPFIPAPDLPKENHG